MNFADCISCNAEISFSTTPKMGHLVKCPQCNAELEVVWLDPIELDWPFDDDYDGEDEEYYYEEED